MDKEKNLIFVPFAFLEGYESGVNVKKNNAYEIYCKNLCVALLSAKRFNPDDDVALVVNQPLPTLHQEILQKNGVLTIQIPFETFNFGKDYPWSLAFYKLCALKAVVEGYDYPRYAYMDADVIVQSSFENIWTECDKHLLLYDINHGLGVRNYHIFVDEVKAFCPQCEYITHYGGEFFAANQQDAKDFVKVAEKIFKDMQKKNYVTTVGDEFILSIAANQMGNKVKNAGAYVYRFWTRYFHLISTCYKYNPVTVLHFPDEKKNGIIKIFDRYIVKGKFPPLKKVYRLCHIKKPEFRIRILQRLKKDAY